MFMYPALDLATKGAVNLKPYALGSGFRDVNRAGALKATAELMKFHHATGVMANGPDIVSLSREGMKAAGK